MKSEVETFQSGWLGLRLIVNEEDIDELVHRLRSLKQREIGHFHIRRKDFSGAPNIADVEFSLNPGDLHHELEIE